MNGGEHSLGRALDRHAGLWPDKVFLYAKGSSLSYGQVHDLVGRIAAFLRASGIKPGDRVGLMLPRIPELVLSFLAATRIGALPVPVNYLLPPKTLGAFLRDVAPRAMISSARFPLTAIEAELIADHRILRIDVANSQPGWIPWRQVVDGPAEARFTEEKGSGLAYLNYTTGSSGQPKGALATHGNIYWNTRAAVSALAMGPDDVHLCMFGAFAHPHELLARPLYTGGSLVLLEEFNPRSLIRAINQYGVTCMMGLAPMYEAMALHCSGMAIDSLRIVESGGMITRRPIHQLFRAAFGRPILSVWGSTETSGIALANTPENFRIDGSIGRPCPYYQVRVIDDAGGELTVPNRIGELSVRGPGVISGYLGQPFAEEDQGWYATGDLVTVDEDGFYHFIDRKSGMLKVAGLKVYPLQVELALLNHPQIAETAVVGRIDRRKGVIPKAFIVARQGADIDRGELLAFCQGCLPAYMVPKEFEIIEELPRIGSGKIDKRALIQ